MNKRIILLSTLVGATAQANTLDPIIFSSKTEAKSSQLTSTHYVVDKEVIENNSNLRLTDLLNKVPGVDIRQTGITGGAASVFIRGADHKHTVLMIDGVKVSDPSNIAREFNPSFLNTLDIEKIEILKGAQSVLYGSNAIGGVINIITKKAENKHKISLGTGIVNEVAASNTFNVGSGLIYFNGFYQTTESESDVVDTDEKDIKLNRGATINANFDFGKVSTETMLKFVDNFSEVDVSDFSTDLPKDDENAYSKNRYYAFNEKISFPFHGGSLVTNINYSNYDRKEKSSTVTKLDGTRLDTEVRYAKNVGNKTMVTGVSRAAETYRDNSTSELTLVITDAFSNISEVSGNNTYEVGLRGTNNEDFGTHAVYNLGWKNRFAPGHEVSITHKTGYKAPSPYQLYAPDTFGPTGNEDLSPEKSSSVEIAHEFKKDELSRGISFFYTDIENYIGWETGKGYQNVDNRATRGVELYESYSFDSVSFGASLIALNFIVRGDDKVERRPEHTVKTYLDYKINDHHQVGVDWLWSGKSLEVVNKVDTELESYDVVDLDYVFSSGNIKTVVGIKNLFDTEYEVAKNYSTQRRGVQANLIYNY